MISWSYYGEQCWVQLFGVDWILLYQLIFLLFVVAGTVFQAVSVLEFGDLRMLGLGFPTVLGVVLLSNRVKAELDRYLGQLRAGAFPRRPA